MTSGEPDAGRLLELARRELLQEILPQVGGDQHYRLRLVANALKIAQQEFGAGADAALARASWLAAFAKSSGLPPDEAALRSALRAGQLDGNSELFRLLSDITRNRIDQLG